MMTSVGVGKHSPETFDRMLKSNLETGRPATKDMLDDMARWHHAVVGGLWTDWLITVLKLAWLAVCAPQSCEAGQPVHAG